MNLFDFGVIGIIILSGFLAFSRGVVREALSVACWINASFAAYYGYGYVTPLFELILPKGQFAELCAGGTVFILALMVLHMISNALTRRVRENTVMVPVDRTFGLLFGLMRGVIMVCLGYIALVTIMGDRQPRWLADAKSVPYLAHGASKISGLWPLRTHGQTPATATATARSEPAAPSKETGSSKEADRAIGAYAVPNARPAPPASGNSPYSANDQRDMNRLIQQNAR